MNNFDECLILFFSQNVPIEKLNIDGLEFLEKLEAVPVEKIITLIEANQSTLTAINSDTIPQYSSIDSLSDALCILCESTLTQWDVMSLGKRLSRTFNPNGKDGAYRKYGENHFNLAVQLGLAVKHEKKKPLAANDLGMAYYLYISSDKYNIRKRNAILARLALRVPIVQRILIDAAQTHVDVLETLLRCGISESTAKRRRSSVRNLLSFIRENSNTETIHRFDNID